jgi:hypothetical protein
MVTQMQNFDSVVKLAKKYSEKLKKKKKSFSISNLYVLYLLL